LSFSFNIDEIGIEDTASIPEVLAFIVIANIEMRRHLIKTLKADYVYKKIIRIACLQVPNNIV
jgi:hypothetical protein